MLKPQDIMIGDWLLADGKVIQVAAIHQKKVGYHNVPNKLTWVRLDRLGYIKITPETLTAFGFVKKEEWDGWLNENAWEFSTDKLSYDEGSPFALSWFEEEDGCRQYKIVSRGYGEYMFLSNDSISEMQHFFYQFTGGNVMPIKYQSNK